LALLATLLTFGLAGQHQLVASALALWWSGRVVFVSFEHLRWVGFDGHHVASGGSDRSLCLGFWTSIT
jgi:hypothetical protein